MAKKKIYLNCPKCHSPITPQQNIGTVGVCRCGWAGSYRSENHEDWLQIKVSLLLIAFGLSLSYGILHLKSPSTPSVSKEELATSSSSKRSLVSTKKSLKPHQHTN